MTHPSRVLNLDMKAKALYAKELYLYIYIYVKYPHVSEWYVALINQIATLEYVSCTSQIAALGIAHIRLSH